MGKKQRLKKEERKNLKGWAEGGRERILSKHVLPYSDCLELGWHAELACLEEICCKYYFHVGWRLLDHEEPAQPFRLYNPHAPRKHEELTPEEAKQKCERVEEIDKRIRRWLRYRTRKLQKKRLKLQRSMLHDPWNLYLAKLAGITKPPKARQAYQEWFTEPANTKLIANIVAERWDKQVADGTTTDGPNAGLQMAVARELFQALDPEVREEWKEKARDVVDHNKREYVNLLKAPLSKDPVERQLCINNLPAFAAPLLRGISERTGLAVFMIVGGPMPRNNGQLGTLNLSWRKNLEDKPVAWPHWDAKRFKEQVQDFFLDFLHTAYTADDCEKAQLPEGGSQDAGELYGFDDELKGVNQDLDDVLDSSSEEEEAEEQPDATASPPRKHKRVAAKGSNVAKATKESVQRGGKGFNKENLPACDGEIDEGSGVCANESTWPKLSKYERQREENIAAIANHPLMKEINEDLERMRAKKAKPCPKKTTTTTSGPSRSSTRLASIQIDDSTSNDKAASNADGGSEDEEGSGNMRDVCDGDMVESTGSSGGNVTMTDETDICGDRPLLESSSVGGGAETTKDAPSALDPPTPTDTNESSTIAPTGSDFDEGILKIAPEWLAHPYKVFANGSLGDKYNDFLQKWALLEEKKKFDSPRKGLSTQGRPQLLSKWVGQGRMRGPMPKIDADTMDEYEKEWWNWWEGMQPSWRE
ncbi:hypothetical protein EV421DRAFT_1738840 [Armillaria borealis]|uniref:Uncharacterized protein n=1 Tax=Armillaria borealis TaxID=47425 RepID=A0AA39MK63_9AGAR|nr:hypothetical protein EV421DRAFT_1738840 [Armillaria borealis]